MVLRIRFPGEEAMLGCCHKAGMCPHHKRGALRQADNSQLTQVSQANTNSCNDPLPAKRAPRSAALNVSGLSPRAIARKRRIPGAENYCRKGCCVICCPGLTLPLDCQVLSSCWPPSTSRSRQLVDRRHWVFACFGRGKQVHTRVSWLWLSLVRCDRKSVASCGRAVK